MLNENKLTAPQLAETVGLETANRIQDNANNYMGMPSLGSGTGAVLHGQLHEFLGAVPDIKARIADKLEQQMTQNQQDSSKLQREKQPAPDDSLKFKP